MNGDGVPFQALIRTRRRAFPLRTTYETGTRTVRGLRRLVLSVLPRAPDFLPLCDEHRARSADRSPDGGALPAARDAADDGAGAGADRALLDVVLRAGLASRATRAVSIRGSRPLP